MNRDVSKGIVKLVVTIVDRGNGQKITEICNREQLHFHFICFGCGTADSEMLDYLGIGETEKDVVISMVPDSKIPLLLSTLLEEMQLKSPGKGISFTMPISGIGSLISKLLMREERIKIESEVRKMECNVKYALVIIVVNRGYSDVVMTAAKSVGVTGGTMLDARGIGYEEAEKFLGISIQSEKNILAILCSQKDKHTIMETINQVAGMRTEAGGIVLSLPVDNIIGINGLE
ncbi:MULTISPECIES: P-II family nitrogen regulator [Tissierellales]|jgi:nitrogen regulatory protein PII|uniref:Nitrogen regulatory protein P-II n=1 Tax=Acidilutibacter cellobiosedens TaxID=2507161 RepID=A0A410QA60_9FIRM|nr:MULTISPECIES: P-II family nitrogen regulator [Tissierellales]MBE6081513.1 hypothetical protein [Tissierellaceae bacterium]QAT60849.1 hypothetical protein EQM13_04280 [Acidilutibacter cellobiosedens]SCL90469.1 hypothetical protein PP176A_1975 [Sporanaerobacter sp. PP17-6a]